MFVGAGFVATVVLLNGRLYGPEHQVGLYLEALQQGDGGKALGLLNASVPEGSNPTLLDGEALRRASASLGDVEVGDARTTDGDRVEVPVTYSVEAAVNGVDVGLPDGRAALAAFYPTVVDATYEGKYFSAPPQHAAVTSRDTPPPALALATEATPELVQAVND